MTCNIALWDRILRFIFGTITLAWAIAGGPIWGFVGIYFITTSGWGFCPIFSFLKIRTLAQKDSGRENYVQEN